MATHTPTSTDIAWLAGLLEGEGCFHAYPSSPKYPDKKYPTIELKMTDLDVVQRAATMMGNPKIGLIKSKSEHHKQAYRIRKRGSHARKILELILPHMGTRRSKKIEELLND